MSSPVLFQAASKIVGGTDVIAVACFAVQNVKESHGGVDGRPVGARTPDLHRVKVAL